MEEFINIPEVTFKYPDDYQEPMNIWSAEGEKVTFLGKNGHDWEQVDAKKYLVAGQEYTVDWVEVGGWTSYVQLKEFPDETFNSVMFANVSDNPKEVENKSGYTRYL
jgi:hypothetical protein